jgi:archaellum component FlaD/FlaE
MQKQLDGRQSAKSVSRAGKTSPRRSRSDTSISTTKASMGEGSYQEPSTQRALMSAPTRNKKEKDREKENERGRSEENNKEMEKEKDKEEKDKGKEKDQEMDKDKEKDKEKEKDKKKGKEHLHAHLCPTPSHPAITLVTSPCRLHRLSLCSH